MNKKYPAQYDDTERLFQDAATIMLVFPCSLCGIDPVYHTCLYSNIDFPPHSAVQAGKIQEQPLRQGSTWTCTPTAQHKPVVIANQLV
jgi:hypothetical protein